MRNALKVVLLSMLPITELRGSIPIAIHSFGMHPFVAAVLAIIGNMIPTPFIILFIRFIFNYLKRFKLFRGIILWLEKRAAGRAENISNYELLGLFIFVALPLPGTGAWTGALIAAFLEMRLRKALPVLLGALVTSSVIVVIITLTVKSVMSGFAVFNT